MASRGMKTRTAVAGIVMAGAGVACGRALARRLARKCGRESGSLHGAIVLITGGSRGLGLAMAEEFGKSGAKLALTARNVAELERARSLLVDMRAAPRENIFIFPRDLRPA